MFNTDGCARQKPPYDQAHLDVARSKQWRVDVWLQTKQCLERGSYIAQGRRSIPLPPINTDIAPMDLDQLHVTPQIRQRSAAAATGSVPSNSSKMNNETHPEAKTPNSHLESGKQEQQQTSTTVGPTTKAVAAASQVPKPLKAEPSQQLRVSVYRGDCLDAAALLYEGDPGSSVLVMDAASSRHFGGGYTRGSRAQEEEMCRRTSLALQMDRQWKYQVKHPYPILPGCGVFVPGCTVFRSSCFDNYAYLPTPFQVAFGIVAAPNQPHLTETGHLLDPTPLLRTLRLFFRMGAATGQKYIVPVALGTGAFKCPAVDVSRLMCEAIAAECSNTCVEHVCIAVFDDHNSVRETNKEGNFVPFARAAMKFFGESVRVFDGGGNDLKREVV